VTTICPTITAEEPHGYRAQAERIEPFAVRWHVDVADTSMAPRSLLALDNVWWPGNVQVDIHMMYKNPWSQLDVLLAQRPRLVIIHAEAEGDFNEWASQLRAHGIEVGIALQPNVPVDLIAQSLASIDHVLIFSGNIGYQGGSHADLTLLDKVAQLRQLKPALEIGWDGGINDQNAKAIAAAGVDVLNVGGYIHAAHNPRAAYAKLVSETV
jgi:ribulose-phosphate 3-epimerase